MMQTYLNPVDNIFCTYITLQDIPKMAV